MAVYRVQDTSLTAVADAIRAKAGTSDALTFPDGFVEAVGGIQAGGGGSSGGLEFLTGTVVAAETGVAGQWTLPIPVFLKDKNVLPTSGVVIVYAERNASQAATEYLEAIIVRFYETDGVPKYDHMMYGRHKNMSKTYCPYVSLGKDTTTSKNTMFTTLCMNANPSGIAMHVLAGDVYRWIAVGEAFTE